MMLASCWIGPTVFRMLRPNETDQRVGSFCGPGPLVLPLRHPLDTAKAATSVDQLSDGRFLLGGNAAGFTLGALTMWENDLSTVDDDDQSVTLPQTNYTVVRVRKDILRKSDIGGLFINKDSAGEGFNRTFGAIIAAKEGAASPVVPMPPLLVDH